MKALKQNVGMLFDNESHPIAIYWKNGTGLKYFMLKEASETDMDNLWEVGQETVKQND